jgi:hypothetical protein
MTDSESLANSLDQKFNELIQLHQKSLTKIVELETELEEHKKKLAKNSDALEQKFNEQLKSQEILKQENLQTYPLLIFLFFFVLVKKVSLGEVVLNILRVKEGF